MCKIGVILLWCVLILCSPQIAGTGTDVNSGSIAGLILNKDDIYKDTILAVLSSNDTVVRNVLTSNGHFKFDSLPKGIYSISVFKDSILIGSESSLLLERNEDKTVNIQITIIINQVFNITTIENIEHITVNNYYINGTSGFLDSLGSGNFRVSFTEQDTVELKLAVTVSNEIDTLSIFFVKNPDGTYSSTLPVNEQTSFRIVNGTTVWNTGNGSDSSTIIITSEIQEEGP